MRVYILTSEPYHDNGCILGVWLDQTEAIAALKAAPNPKNINEEDCDLVEWDTETNKPLRYWVARGERKEVYGSLPWDPIHKGTYAVGRDFSFLGPIDADETYAYPRIAESTPEI